MKATLLSSLALFAALTTPFAQAEDNGMEAAGRQIFNHNCTACHSLEPSKNTFGPSLIGVVGREAASMPRFSYSKALQESGITWTEDNLRKWIADNDGFIPGTRMRHVAITDQAEQDYLISFLKSLK